MLNLLVVVIVFFDFSWVGQVKNLRSTVSEMPNTLCDIYQRRIQNSVNI